MHILLTSCHGWIGSHITPLLLAEGPTITGLSRSASSSTKITSLGASPLTIPLEQPDAIAAFVRSAGVDAVIHTAYDHQWSPAGNSVALDLAFIEAIGAVLKGTAKPFIVTFTCTTLTENDSPVADHPSRRTANEAAVLRLAEQGVKALILRLPPTVHGRGDTKFIADLVAAAKVRGVSVYPKNGKGVWSAVHVRDAARLYLLALHKGVTGRRYHAVAERGIGVKEIAREIAAKLGVETRAVEDDELGEYVGYLAPFLRTDYTAESAITRRELWWRPEERGLLDHEIRGGAYELG